MAPPHFPDGLDQGHAAERGGIHRHASFWSVAILGLLVALALSGLLGGGRSAWLVDDAPAARLAVHSPRIARSGIFFETRIAITAKRDIAEPVLAVTPALWRDMTVNTALPDAKAQAFSDGAFRFTYDALKAGDTLELKFDGQINPPLFAGTRGRMTLLDGDRRLAAVAIRTRVLP